MTQIGQNAARTRQLNRRMLLSYILGAGPQSRINLAGLSQLTPGAITHLTADLLAEGLLEEVDEPSTEAAGRPGRRSTLLDIIPQARMVLGIHLTPERVIMALVDLGGGVHLKRTYPLHVDGEPEDAIRQTIGAGIRIMREAPSPVLGVGVAVSGMVDTPTGEIIRMRVKGWEGVPLRERLAGAFGLPTVLDHNVRAMALSEVLFGAGRDGRHLVFLHVGRSVSAGLVMDGRLLTGGGIGHSKHNVCSAPSHSDDRCWCGRQGCLEIQVSELALIRRCEMATEESPVRRLLASPQYESVLRSAGEFLGGALANALSFVDIGRVVFGGTLLRTGTAYREACEAALRERTVLTSGRQPEFLTTNLGRNLGTLGAGALALREFVY